MTRRRPAPTRAPAACPAALDLDRLLTAEEVGARLGLRPREVRRLFHSVAIIFGRKLVRFHPADIQAELTRYRRRGPA